MLKRSFVPGDEWLYYKLYCNPLNADIILINYLKPLLDSLKNEMRVKNSFFVRYEDPKYHIRLRIQFNTISEISNALIKISQRLHVALSYKLIYNVELSTYERELERYSYHNIELFERAFSSNSYFVLSVLNYIQDPMKKIFLATKMIDSIFTSFGLSNERRLTICNSVRRSLINEFNADKAFLKSLNSMYSMERKKLRMFLESSENAFNNSELIVELNKYSDYSKTIYVELVKQENFKYEGLISLVHMNINRVFTTSQRMYELICYEFITKHYKYLKYRD